MKDKRISSKILRKLRAGFIVRIHNIQLEKMGDTVFFSSEKTGNHAINDRRCLGDDPEIRDRFAAHLEGFLTNNGCHFVSPGDSSPHVVAPTFEGYLKHLVNLADHGYIRVLVPIDVSAVEDDAKDAEVSLFINQANRHSCVVIKVTPTRCRIEYELPKSGWVQGWRPIERIHGDVYIERGYF